MIIDAFPMNDELDMLECRLVELHDVVDGFVLVEAEVDHQGNPKPLHYANNLERFAEWGSKIRHVIVRAEDMPSVEEHPNPWAREHAQREHIARGVSDLPDDTVILQSDVDEIPRRLYVRNCRPRRGAWLSFPMQGRFWSLNWLYPEPWFGTVAARLGDLRDEPLGIWPWMRDSRNGMPHPHGAAPTSQPIVTTSPRNRPPAGWHLSWLGGPERALKKVGSFCHPEVEAQIRAGIDEEFKFWSEGVHVDGLQMSWVGDDDLPRWILDGRAPASWWGPVPS